MKAFAVLTVAVLVAIGIGVGVVAGVGEPLGNGTLVVESLRCGGPPPERCEAHLSEVVVYPLVQHFSGWTGYAPLDLPGPPPHSSPSRTPLRASLQPGIYIVLVVSGCGKVSEALVFADKTSLVRLECPIP